MTWQRALAVLVLALVALLCPTHASALDPCGPKTRVGGLGEISPTLVGAARAASAGTHRENRFAYGETASDATLAAEGIGGGGASFIGGGGGGGVGRAFSGTAYELRFIPRHLEGTAAAGRLITREGAAHVFSDMATLARVENAIFEGGRFTGVVRGTERFGLMFESPIGYRIAADGSSIPLFYGEAKVGANGLYHVFPRTGPAAP